MSSTQVALVGNSPRERCEIGGGSEGRRQVGTELLVGSYSWGRKDLSCFIGWRKGSHYPDWAENGTQWTFMEM